MQSALQDEIETLRARYRSGADPAGLAFASLADAYRRAGQMEEAWSVLEEGLEDHPDFATGHLVAARVLRDRGDRVGAADRFARVLELDPDNTEALLEAAALAQHEGRIGDALFFCQRLALLDPTDADLRARIRALKEVHFTSASAEKEEDAPAEPREETEGDGAPGREAPEEEASGERVPEQEQLPTFGETWAGDSWSDQTRASTEEEEEPEAETPGRGEEPVVEVAPDEDEPEETGGEPAGAPGEDEESEVFTRTMADLYARQGHVRRALKIYGHLLDRDPDDETLRTRIRELEAEESEATDEGPSISEYFATLLGWRRDGTDLDEDVVGSAP